MRIAVYGGAFDPPHLGHHEAVEAVLEQGQADMVIMVPTAYHAFGKAMAPHEERVRWCEAMVRENPLVKVSKIEAGLPAPNLTLNTMRALGARYPEHELVLIMGEDNARNRNLWQGWPDLDREFPGTIVVGRDGASGPFPTRIDVRIENSTRSSTLVRKVAAEGGNLGGLLHKDVMDLYLDYLKTKAGRG